MLQTEKNCTIRELARYVSLSTCTVSKVLNDVDNALPIPERTRRKVREAAKKLNYVPNVNAQRFFRRRSFVVGLLVPPQDEMGHNAFRDTHLCDIVSGIESALSRTRYNLLMLFNRLEYKHENRYAGLFSSGMLDGLLIWGAHRSDSSWKELIELSAPKLFLTSVPDFSPDSPPDFIASDYEEAAFGIAERLRNSGSRRLGWLAGKQDTSIIPQLAAGIRRAGVEIPQERILYSDYTEADGVALARRLLADGCDGLFATAPQLARGAQQAVGAEVRIGCFDGQAWTRLPGDRFLSVQTDDVGIGRMAVEHLVSIIENEGERGPGQLRVPVRFTEQF